MTEFKYERRIDFSDTDMGGIVHFSRFFVFMETAEHEFLRALGTSVDKQVDGQHISWPRVSASCDYRAPAKFGEVLEVRVRVKRRGVKSMTYSFEFRRGDTLIAEGETTAVCCVMHNDRAPEPIEIPGWFAQAMEGDDGEPESDA